MGNKNDLDNKESVSEKKKRWNTPLLTKLNSEMTSGTGVITPDGGNDSKSPGGS